MFYLDIPTIEGIKRELVYNVKDFPYTSFLYDVSTVRKNKKNYLNLSATFDIETTTIETEKDKKGKYKIPPYGFMYHWQACIRDKVIFGRTWNEFLEFLNVSRETLRLGKYNILVIYVHNLPYEFQFMKDFIEIDSMFSRAKRKPLKIISNGIEFRCSYALSNMNLLKFCENSELCTYYKLSDKYDYKIIRTPKTVLTSIEQAYCYNDVRGLAQCIDTLLLEDTIASIPLTSTGYVRRDCRSAMNKNTKNHDNFIYTQLSVKQYSLLKALFRGGNTHASRFFSNQILSDVHSIDLQSSYPAWMNLDYYPIRKFTDVTLNTLEKITYYTEKYCTCMEIEFYNIVIKESNPFPYIDIAHCKRHSNIVNDNGRILSADYISLSITEIDYKIIQDSYYYDEMYVNYAMYAERGKLPKELRTIILKFFNKKTILKDDINKLYEYLKSKNKLNGIFGMMVTDLAHNEYIYSDNEWTEKIADLEESINKFYRSRNNFLSYQWGVYVTAHAREHLQEMLNIVKMDGIYIDTDSVKFFDKKGKYTKQIAEINARIIKLDEENDIKGYATKNGKNYYLGAWEDEGIYKKFKTLGAKKYAVVYNKDKKHKQDEFEITVAGMGKEKGSEVVSNIENFNIGKTYYNVGRTIAFYNESAIKNITVDDCTFLTASNIGLVDSTYKLGITNEYWDVLEDAENMENEINGESEKNSLTEYY